MDKCARWLLALVLGASSVPAARAAEIDSLVRAIADAKAYRVEEALAVLPEATRANYTLVFSSRSLQGASFSAPRAILFGADARLVVTFNGDPDARGFDALETMEFDPSTSSFHFREIAFRDGLPPEVSEDNPARCVACHGRPARPIWDSAPTWPGVYGERYRSGLSEKEAQGMHAFLLRQPQDPRYRWLINAARFSDRTTYVGSAHDRYNGEGFEPPNARLGALLSAMQERALMTELASASQFRRYRYALLSAADPRCSSVAGLLSADERSAVESAVRRLRPAPTLDDQRQATESASRRASRTDGYRAGFRHADLTEFRALAEELVGLRPQRWMLPLDRDGADLAIPDGIPDPAAILAVLIGTTDPDLGPARHRAESGDSDAYCAYLRSAHLRVQQSEAAPPTGIRPTAVARVAADEHRPELVQRCAECHTGAVGPKLPFADPAALKTALQDAGYRRGRLLDEILFRLSPAAGPERMPRGILTTAAQQSELERYFLNLAGPSRP